MRAKTLLTILFGVSFVIAAIAFVQVMGRKSAANIPKEQVLAATMSLPAGTFLRAQDVTWREVSAIGPDQIVHPATAAVDAKPGLDDEMRASVYGAVLRQPLAAGEPIRRGAFVKPGERDFLQVVLSPGSRAIAIPVATGGASSGLLSPGDHVDVILTQNFAKNDSGDEELRHTSITRKSVSERIVENLRVLAINEPDTKPNTVPMNGGFGRTVTLEVTTEQAERINVATELGKLSVILRSATSPTVNDVSPASPVAPIDHAKPIWAGDVSPALYGAAEPKPEAVARPPVTVFRGGPCKTENDCSTDKSREIVKQD